DACFNAGDYKWITICIGFELPNIADMRGLLCLDHARETGAGGCLNRTRTSQVVPELVTATSGQIIVLAEWLQGKDLEASLVNPKLEHNSFAQLAVAFGGESGVFRPAYLEALKRWWSLPLGEKNPLEGLFDRLFPAQLYVPTRKQADFDNIARVLNSATGSDGREIGVVFNAYNLKTGRAVLFGNEKARQLWPKEKPIQQATRSVDVRSSRSGREEPALGPITAQAVESALWLSLYGFDHLPQPHLMDGARTIAPASSPSCTSLTAFLSHVRWR